MEMQECMRGHPDLYGEEDPGDKLMEGEEEKEPTPKATPSTAKESSDDKAQAKAESSSQAS